MSVFHVTGSRGFVAGHLIAELERRGNKVTRTDSERAFDPWLPPVCHGLVLCGAMVGRERGSSMAAVEYNARSPLIWARYAARRGVPVLYVSTSEVYGPRRDEHPVAEYHELEPPHNLYGLSKRWGEMACELELPAAGLTVARLSMPYGPGHPPGSGRAALTNFLEQARIGGVLTVHRGARRSWCWIGDTVRALADLATVAPAGVWNVGRDDNELDMSDVAELALSFVQAGRGARIELVDPPPGFTLVKRLDCSKLRSTGWRPLVELDEGMARTLDWLENRSP